MARFHDTASRSRLTSTRRSHLLGFIYFAHRALQLAASPGDEFAGTFLRDTSRSEILHAPRWPLFVFLFGACCCLLISATCHTLCCVSKRVNARGWRYDYAGICLLIAGSFFPPISYAFFCVPRVRVFYLALISASAAATLVLCVAERFAGHAWRAVRAATFAALGGFGIVPIIHQSLFMWRPSSLPPTLVRANLYELLMARGCACWVDGRQDTRLFGGHIPLFSFPFAGFLLSLGRVPLRPPPSGAVAPRRFRLFFSQPQCVKPQATKHAATSVSI